MYDQIADIIAYEQGRLADDRFVALFAGFIKTGTINHLPGFYSRTAAALIDSGVLSPTGDILGEPSQ